MKKLTLKEFWNSNEKLAIHCKTKEQAKKFCKASRKLGYKWCDKRSYVMHNNWKTYKEETCYCNNFKYSDLSYLKSNANMWKCTVLEFEDIDWGKE